MAREAQKKRAGASLPRPPFPPSMVPPSKPLYPRSRTSSFRGRKVILGYGAHAPNRFGDGGLARAASRTWRRTFFFESRPGQCGLRFSGSFGPLSGRPVRGMALFRRTNGHSGASCRPGRLGGPASSVIRRCGNRTAALSGRIASTPDGAFGGDDDPSGSDRGRSTVPARPSRLAVRASRTRPSGPFAGLCSLRAA